MRMNTRVLVTAALLIGLGVMYGPGSSAARAAGPQHPPGVPAAPSNCQAWATPFFGLGHYLGGASWTDNSDNETGFDVQWKTTSPSGQGKGTVGPDVSSFTVPYYIKQGTKVTVRVRAFNAAGSSSWTNWATTVAQ